MSQPFRVLISDSMSDKATEVLAASPAVEVVVRPGLAPSDLLATIGDYHGLLVRSRTKVTAEVIEAATALKIVGRAGIGVDNIDIAAASRRGVLVENAPSGNSVTTAEHAIALLCSLARNVPQATASMKAGKWEKNKLEGRELLGKNIGVIGLGNIGRLVAERARGLKMKVLGYDPFISRDAAARLGVELLSFDDLLARADFLTVHTPLTDETRGLLGAEAFAAVKPGVYLVNAARGGIVDEKALVAALESGQVGGVALDVFETEPPPADHPLLADPRVVCTPHLGASTGEAQDKVAVEIAEQIVAFAERGEVRNAINMTALSPEASEHLAPWLALGRSLGALAGQRILSGDAASVANVEVEISGDPAERGEDAVIDAVLIGLLRNFVEEPINAVNASVLAADRGLTVDRTRRNADRNLTSAIGVRASANGRSAYVKGTLFHIGNRLEARVVQLDEILVEAPAAGNLLVVRNRDTPGVIGKVGTLLGSRGINVNSLHVGASSTEGGDAGMAIALWSVSSPLDRELLEAVRAIDEVVAAEPVSL
jgi:D-3-phosphoglycerate dehydrogenase